MSLAAKNEFQDDIERNQKETVFEQQGREVEIQNKVKSELRLENTSLF